MPSVRNTSKTALTSVLDSDDFMKQEYHWRFSVVLAPVHVPADYSEKMFCYDKGVMHEAKKQLDNRT